MDSQLGSQVRTDFTCRYIEPCVKLKLATARISKAVVEAFGAITFTPPYVLAFIDNWLFLIPTFVVENVY